MLRLGLLGLPRLIRLFRLYFDFANSIRYYSNPDLQVDTTTPQGYMILTVMSAIAKLERDIINERTQGGRRAKAENGGYAFGSPRFGQNAVDGDLVAHDSEQQAIEVIRRHRKSGKSYQRVAEYLNQQNIPTKRAGQWQAMTVKRVCDRLKKKKAA